MTRDRQPFFLDPDYEHFEPGQSRLKLSTLTGVRTWEILLLTVLSLVVSVCLIAIFLTTEARHRQFMHEGVETTFTVTSCYTIRNSSKNGTTYTAHLTFNYWIGDQTVSNDAKLSGKCEQYPLESRLTGVYLAGNPSETEVMSIAQLRQPFFIRQQGFLAGFLILLCTAALTLSQARKVINGRRKQRYLHENGRLLEGRITSATSEYRNKNQQHYVIIQYRFDSPEGTSQTGKQDMRRDDLRPDPLPGCWGRWFTRGKQKRKNADINRLPVYGTPVRVLYADESTHIML
jgi:hypothetical protein